MESHEWGMFLKEAHDTMHGLQLVYDLARKLRIRMTVLTLATCGLGLLGGMCWFQAQVRTLQVPICCFGGAGVSFELRWCSFLRRVDCLW